MTPLVQQNVSFIVVPTVIYSCITRHYEVIGLLDTAAV